MKTENEENYCTLYLVRHGETEWNVKKINQGQSESFLTEKGIEQAKETAERLKDIKFDAIFSSDLSRTQRTAEIIKLDRELIIQTSQLLREIAVVYPGKNVLVVSHAGPIRNFLVKIGYAERKALAGGTFKQGGYVKVFSDGVDFFVKEV